MARTTRTRALTGPAVPSGPFTLPHRFLPRSYQREVFAAYERGCKRFVLCWHRRSGKDRLCLALTTVAMADRPGLYMHIYPTNELARKAMWIAQDRDSGAPFLESFPPQWLDGEPNKTEMLIRVKPLPGQAGGSIWKLAGADDPDSLRGMNPVGVVLSEFSEHDPRVWEEILSPILNENDGWVIFNFTPKGKNHAYRIFQTAQAHRDRWFCSLKTVDDTVRDAPGEKGGPVVPPEKIAQERDEGRAEEVIQQESYCSFDGFVRGTIFGDVLRRAKGEGRIRPLMRDAREPVGVCFDIGQSDGTCALFYQTYGRGIQWIDCAFAQGKDKTWWHRYLQSKPYLYGRIVLPWDMDAERFGQEETVTRFFQTHYRCPVVVAEKFTVQAGIDMVRSMFSLFAFDELAFTKRSADAENPGNQHVPAALDAFGNYRRVWDEVKQDYSGQPVHDITSHFADALRTGVVGGLTPLEGGMAESLKPADRIARMAYNPLKPLSAQRDDGRYARTGL